MKRQTKVCTLYAMFNNNTKQQTVRKKEKSAAKLNADCIIFLYHIHKAGALLLFHCDGWI